ncbi:hypothetical protein X975_20549, partial [Stegodyphus mimosarum]
MSDGRTRLSGAQYKRKKSRKASSNSETGWKSVRLSTRHEKER